MWRNLLRYELISCSYEICRCHTFSGKSLRNQCYAGCNEKRQVCGQCSSTCCHDNIAVFCSASSTSRAWQALPRHLRRRSASHDVRRVPLRLRDKARAEVYLLVRLHCWDLSLRLIQMDPVRKKALGRSLPKLGRSKRLTRTETLMKRQRLCSPLTSSPDTDPFLFRG